MRPIHRTALATAVALTVSLTTVLTGVLGAAPGTATAAAPSASIAGLKVLLTNDDSARAADSSYGTDGKGLYELRKALCAAGADVLVVAPWRQQSGVGGKMTVPGFAPVPLTVQAVSPPAAYAGDCAGAGAAGAVFGVCQAADACTSETPSASPSDAVYVALGRFAATHWAGGPDVVLSGVNFGQKVGTTANHSGTVAAVVTAHEHAVPAIAFSAEVPHDLAQIPNVPFAQTSAYAVELLGDLVAADDLDGDLLLNVNHPFVEAGSALGAPVKTVLGASNDIGLTYTGDVPSTGGTYQVTAGTPAAETRQGADTTALAGNHISITPLDGDWTLPPVATVDPPVPTVTATSVRATATPERDRKRPYATVVSGRLDGAGAACRGSVSVTANGTVRVDGTRRKVAVRGARTLALRSVDGACRFTGSLRIKSVRAALARRALSGTVSVQVRFAGTDTLAPSRGTLRVRLG